MDSNLYRFLFKVLKPLNATLANPDEWRPQVQYFEQRPDQSVLAHVIFEQPINDTRNATELEADMNASTVDPTNVEGFIIGGTLI